MKKIVVIFAILVALLLIAMQCRPRFNSVDIEMAQGKITIGMTVSQIEQAIGKPSTHSSEYVNSATGNRESIAFYWDSRSNRKLRVFYVDGKVASIRVVDSSE